MLFRSDVPEIIPPYESPNGKHVYHIYMIQLARDCPVSKEDFMYELYYHKGVKAWSHYLPIHLSKPFRDMGHREGECPVYEEVFNRFVTLPIFPAMTEEAVHYMAESIKDVLAGK